MMVSSGVHKVRSIVFAGVLLQAMQLSLEVNVLFLLQLLLPLLLLLSYLSSTGPADPS